MIAASSSGVISFGRPERGRSLKRPLKPSASYRSSQQVTVGLDTPSCWQIALPGWPSAEASTIFARSTIRCGVVRERVRRSKRLRSPRRNAATRIGSGKKYKIPRPAYYESHFCDTTLGDTGRVSRNHILCEIRAERRHLADRSTLLAGAGFLGPSPLVATMPLVSLAGQVSNVTEVLSYIVGFALAGLTVLLARTVGFDRDRAFYPVLVIVIHGSLVSNSGVPLWWPPFCLALDFTIAAGLAWTIFQRKQAAGNNEAAVRTICEQPFLRKCASVERRPRPHME